MTNSEAVVFFSTAGSIVYGINAHGVFGARVEKRGSEIHAALKDGKDPRAVLGKECTVILPEQIKTVAMHQDSRHSIIVSAKGLGDDVGILADSESDQRRFFAAIESRLNGGKGRQTRRASLMQVAMMPVMFTIIVAIFTFCGFATSLQMDKGDFKDSTKIGMRGTEERGFANVVRTLGAGGVLVVGGVLFLIGCSLIYRKSKMRYNVITLLP